MIYCGKIKNLKIVICPWICVIFFAFEFVFGVAGITGFCFFWLWPEGVVRLWLTTKWSWIWAQPKLRRFLQQSSAFYLPGIFHFPLCLYLSNFTCTKFVIKQKKNSLLWFLIYLRSYNAFKSIVNLYEFGIKQHQNKSWSFSSIYLLMVNLALLKV